jgi:beta-N-acetylhexosaminidase
VSGATSAARAAAGAVLVCGVEGTELTPQELAFYASVAPSGVTLFARNVADDPKTPGSFAPVAALCRALQTTRPRGAPPLIIAIDQEGGRVRRLKAPFPDHGPAMHLAGGRDDEAALAEVQAAAQALGARLAALGINVNFAPVLDVLTEPTNTAIGDRAFGTTATAVSRRGGAYLDGLTAAGVLGCLKHFPGQGDAKVDTHLGSARIATSRPQLDERELAPFKAHLGRAPMVMISHCIYPALADEEASRSQRVINGLLRDELGFRGVVVSDDMNMGAIPQDLGPWAEAVVGAVAAGADMILVCRHLERYQAAHATLAREAERSPAFARRLGEAAARVLALRAKL